MKLTNYLRDSFIHSVSNDTPKPMFDVEAAQAAAVKLMHPKVRSIYKDEELRKSLVSHQKYFTSDGYHRVVLGNVAQEDVFGPHEAAIKARDDAMYMVKSVAYGCTTLKQLREQLPDLVAHMPTEDGAKITNLPATTGVMDALKAAGFKG